MDGLIGLDDDGEVVVPDAAAAAAAADSSMDSDAIAPGAGVSEAGMFVGGCCLFLIMSL